ncbi:MULTISPECIES: O-antigen ligase family protein [Nocardioides]|uniref:O-antigen ligase family protein n=1 Tax=Nocardioides vastitatis TaxID=2568655 RepID=A0ABW0ZCZ7_9ACTN|nr:O-antigen ligase family protein [Nocardioides sp.]THJ02345.1 O-antigen ligase family protein [Nocardioides sp.]
MSSQTSARPVSAAASDGLVERRLVTLALVIGGAGLVAAATLRPEVAMLALLAAGYLLLLALFGRERTAVLTLTAAFATAPMAKGLASAPDSPWTPTDMLLALGILLLVPTLLTRAVRLPGTYLLGVAAIFVTGWLATAVSPDPLASALEFIQWLMLIVGLVCVVALWQPTALVVSLLLGSYVAGHLVSVVVAFAEGPLEGGNRYVGLTHHPNALAEAGLMAVAALLYLFYLRRELWYRLIVLGSAALCVQSVLMSGSRAALLVIAGLVVMIPLVERSVFKGFILALGGALLICALPVVIAASSDGSALDRLAGTQDAEGSDRIRREATEKGLDAFQASPFIGSGFADVIEVHNVVVAVAMATGLIGLIGFFFVLFSLTRPLFTHHPLRRLAYPAWAYVGLMAAVPVLDNRTLWLPVSLSAACWAASRPPERVQVPEEAAVQATASTSREGV